jgi:hypothetical protein
MPADALDLGQGKERRPAPAKSSDAKEDEIRPFLHTYLQKRPHSGEHVATGNDHSERTERTPAGTRWAMRWPGRSRAVKDWRSSKAPLKREDTKVARSSRNECARGRGLVG